MIEQNVPPDPGGEIAGAANSAPVNTRQLSEILGTMNTGIPVNNTGFMMQSAPSLQTAASLVGIGDAAPAAGGAPGLGRQYSHGFSNIPIPNLGQHSRQNSANAFWTAANAAAGGAFAYDK